MKNNKIQVLSSTLSINSSAASCSVKKKPLKERFYLNEISELFRPYRFFDDFLCIYRK